MDLLAHLTTFCRIVDGGSLSGAARATGQSLSVVSRQLAALEAELGAPLVVRSTRRLHVTDAGRELRARAEAILRGVAEAKDAVGNPHQVRGSIVVSASVTYGLERVIPALQRLARAVPELVVHLRLEDRAADLVAEGVDLAIRAGLPPPDSTGFVAHPLEHAHRVLVAAPRHLRRHGRPKQLEELLSHPCLVQVLPSGRALPWVFAPSGEEAPLELRPRPAFTCNAPIVLRDACVAGRGVAFLPDWLVAPAVASGTLELVSPAWRSPSFSTWAVHRAELRGSARVRAVVEALRPEAARGASAGRSSRRARAAR